MTTSAQEKKSSLKAQPLSTLCLPQSVLAGMKAHEHLQALPQGAYQALSQYSLQGLRQWLKKAHKQLSDPACASFSGE